MCYKQQIKYFLLTGIVVVLLANTQATRFNQHKTKTGKRKNVKTVVIPKRLLKKTEDHLINIQGDDPGALSDDAVIDPNTGTVIGTWLVDLTCPECPYADCPDMNDLRKICPAGLVRDACKCCLECASGVGMPCHLTGRSHRQERFPPCGDNLGCIHVPTDLYEDNIGMAQGQCMCTERMPVCGSNNVTYDNVCSFQSDLPQLRYREGVELLMLHDGPCISEPLINSQPHDAEILTGGSATFRCELSGFPAPNIKWFKQQLVNEKTKRIPESSYKFPSTHSHQGEWELPGFFPNAVTQVRGGPGTYQITSWLTIDDVTETDEGKYICRATNEKGTAEASAILSVTRR